MNIHQPKQIQALLIQKISKMKMTSKMDNLGKLELLTDLEWFYKFLLQEQKVKLLRFK